mmetsp:Transcript_69597/g.166977  ORF Transcript_69597/g.166977 Transcript_69597/m.166977 type:complete len:283 (+) Transcript_69597:631-1479(+)
MVAIPTWVLLGFRLPLRILSDIVIFILLIVARILRIFLLCSCTSCIVISLCIHGALAGGVSVLLIPGRVVKMEVRVMPFLVCLAEQGLKVIDPQAHAVLQAFQIVIVWIAIEVSALTILSSLKRQHGNAQAEPGVKSVHHQSDTHWKVHINTRCSTTGVINMLSLRMVLGCDQTAIEVLRKAGVHGLQDPLLVPEGVLLIGTQHKGVAFHERPSNCHSFQEGASIRLVACHSKSALDPDGAALHQPHVALPEVVMRLACSTLLRLLRQLLNPGPVGFGIFFK